MKKNKLKKLFYLFILMLIFLLGSPSPLFISASLSSENYESWMHDSMPLDRKLTDMALLGAHDAFAHPMTYFSACDRSGAFTGETASSLACQPYGWIYKGLLIRFAHTQYYDVTTLLNQGIRYFDVRLSYDETSDQWFHNHTYLTVSLESTMTAISDFLDNHPGEIVILDFQHIYDSRTFTGRGDDNSFEEIKSILVETGSYEQSYSFSAPGISSLSYGEVTQNRQLGRLILTYPSLIEDTHFLNRETYLRSIWHNQIRLSDLFNDIKEEHEFLQTLENQDSMFRVMQAQVTASLNPTDLWDTLSSWSLLDAALQTHQKLMAQEELPSLIQTTPILMLDFAANNDRQVHDQLMSLIIETNNS